LTFPEEVVDDWLVLPYSFIETLDVGHDLGEQDDRASGYLL
jgi:hypothetical protein